MDGFSPPPVTTEAPSGEKLTDHNFKLIDVVCRKHELIQMMDKIPAKKIVTKGINLRAPAFR